MKLSQHILRFAGHLASRMACQVVILDQPALLASPPGYPADSIVLVPDGMRALSSSRALADSINAVSRRNHKVILVDEIDSFLESSQLRSVARQAKLPLEFLGYATGADDSCRYVTILSRALPEHFLPAPASFRVVSIISTYNESDILEPLIGSLRANGVDTYVIDNWSDDGTFEAARALLNGGVIGVERWPSSGPLATFDWKCILERKQDLARELQADWFIQQDADEIRESPWDRINLREAFYCVDRQGYNAVDFTLIEFRPIDNAFSPGSSPEEHFRHFGFDVHPGYLYQIKAWKNLGVPVDLAGSGGHRVEFPGKKVFPYNFLLKHYPIRSQAHGERKIFRERRDRAGMLERTLGWNLHYDDYDPTRSFLRNPRGLKSFDASFREDYLLERLARTGVAGTGEHEAQQEDLTRLAQQLSESSAEIGALRQRLAESERSVADLRQALSLAELETPAHAQDTGPHLGRLWRRLVQALGMGARWMEYLTINSSGRFDADYYLRENPDVKSAGVDPLMHYVKSGWKEGRNPSPMFNTASYLAANPDVSKAGVNPLFHYVRHGIKEGRPASPQA